MCICWRVVSSVSQEELAVASAHASALGHMPAVVCAGTTALPCSLGLVFEMVSYRPGQPQSCFVAKDDLEDDLLVRT